MRVSILYVCMYIASSHDFFSSEQCLIIITGTNLETDAAHGEQMYRATPVDMHISVRDDSTPFPPKGNVLVNA